jgi:NADH dehydrogenase
MEQQKQIVIIGAGYAGMMAALRLANQTRRQPVAITLINAQDKFVERIRLHQLATNQALAERPISSMLRGTGVSFVPGTVTALDPIRKQITLQGAVQPISYDKLVYALGSFTERSRVPGAVEYAFTLDHASAVRLRERLPEVAARGGKVLVSGAGLTGIESATEIAEAYPALRVEVVTSDSLEDDLSIPGAAYVRETFRQLGITLRERTTIHRLEANRALTGGGSALPFDACVWATGFGVSPLARQSGVRVNTAGQIVIDARLRSVSHPDIYAIGDAASFAPESDLSLRMACATALPMAVQAADNLSALLRGKAEQPFGFGYLIRCISLGRRRGLVQFVDADDRPQPRIITGTAGALIKESICRYAFESLSMQRRGIGIYWWSRARGAKPTPELKAAEMRG